RHRSDHDRFLAVQRKTGWRWRRLSRALLSRWRRAKDAGEVGANLVEWLDRRQASCAARTNRQEWQRRRQRRIQFDDARDHCDQIDNSEGTWPACPQSSTLSLESRGYLRPQASSQPVCVLSFALPE